VLLEDLPPLRKIGLTPKDLLRWIEDGIPIPDEVAWLEAPYTSNVGRDRAESEALEVVG
jgi:hypothetical protein